MSTLDNKKPELEIYRPPELRKDKVDSKISSDKLKSKPRRPDAQVYVPKARLSADLKKTAKPIVSESKEVSDLKERSNSESSSEQVSNKSSAKRDLSSKASDVSKDNLNESLDSNNSFYNSDKLTKNVDKTTTVKKSKNDNSLNQCDVSSKSDRELKKDVPLCQNETSSINAKNKFKGKELKTDKTKRKEDTLLKNATHLKISKAEHFTENVKSKRRDSNVKQDVSDRDLPYNFSKTKKKKSVENKIHGLDVEESSESFRAQKVKPKKTEKKSVSVRSVNEVKNDSSKCDRLSFVEDKIQNSHSYGFNEMVSNNIVSESVDLDDVMNNNGRLTFVDDESSSADEVENDHSIETFKRTDFCQLPPKNMKSSWDKKYPYKHVQNDHSFGSYKKTTFNQIPPKNLSKDSRSIPSDSAGILKIQNLHLQGLETHDRTLLNRSQRKNPVEDCRNVSVGTAEISGMLKLRNNVETVFVEKQLFDPKNPSKPQIVSAPVYFIPPPTKNNKRHEKNPLDEISAVERELFSYLSHGYPFSDNLKHCRWKLQHLYEAIILSDPRFCAERNPEQCLWKTVFHTPIEMLRKIPEAKEPLLDIIQEGSMFYETLLEKQQSSFECRIGLKEAEGVPNEVRISLQKTLLSLGDLARYREQQQDIPNYGKARSWYLKAQQIAPKNGRPYHQLALLALNTRRKLDAVYYFMRSLAASNPFLSAKESLLTLFEEAKRKFEQYEKQRQEEEVGLGGGGCEIWLKPAKLSPKELSDVELNKRFGTSFLHVHGKLFTKVGMETMAVASDALLVEWAELLRRRPLPLKSTRLQQLMIINIFAVSRAMMKDAGLGERAMTVSQAMMTVLMDRAMDESQLMPSIKIWTDWMGCNRNLWTIGSSSADVWSSFADLCTTLRQLNISSQEQRTHEGEECVCLEEETSYAGFVPLLGADIRSHAYVTPPYDKEKAKHALRISRILFFCDYLCGVTPPLMHFDVQTKRYLSLNQREKVVQEQRVQPTPQDRLRVRPRFLVPDTNCFVDHLSLLKTLLEATAFHLVVPLVVVSELSGLVRAGRASSESFEFLEGAFAARHPRVRAITARGSLLATLAFRSEETEQGTNDDRILNCCLHYCKDDPESAGVRQVVLLTEDRNLRVRALAHRVPATDIATFAKHYATD